MEVIYISKDHNWQNEQTVYWFDVDGEEYGVSETPEGSAVLDCDSYPVNTGDAKNVHLAVLPEFVTDDIRAS